MKRSTIENIPILGSRDVVRLLKAIDTPRHMWWSNWWPVMVVLIAVATVVLLVWRTWN